MDRLVFAVLSLVIIYLQLLNKSKQLARKKRLGIQKQIQNKRLIAYYRRKRIIHRSCWVSEELLRTGGRGYYERNVPFLTGNFIVQNIMHSEINILYIETAR